MAHTDISGPLKALQEKERLPPLHHVVQSDQSGDSGSHSPDLSSSSSSLSSGSPISGPGEDYPSPVNTLTAQREAFFSAVDHPSVTDELKRRMRPIWLRSPQGAPIPQDLEGKRASNGVPIWGATLQNIYQVCRDPARSAEMAYASGSCLMKWAKEHDRESGWAKEEILRAEREEETREVFPFDRDWAKEAENAPVVASTVVSDAEVSND